MTAGKSTAAVPLPAVWDVTAIGMSSSGTWYLPSSATTAREIIPPWSIPTSIRAWGSNALACIMQGVDNLFLVDTVQNIMRKICAVAGVEYGEDPKKDISLRVITDHIRSTTLYDWGRRHAFQ